MKVQFSGQNFCICVSQVVELPYGNKAWKITPIITTAEGLSPEELKYFNLALNKAWTLTQWDKELGQSISLIPDNPLPLWEGIFTISGPVNYSNSIEAREIRARVRAKTTQEAEARLHELFQKQTQGQQMTLVPGEQPFHNLWPTDENPVEITKKVVDSVELLWP